MEMAEVATSLARLTVSRDQESGYSRRGHTRQGRAGWGRAWHIRQGPVANLGRQGKACYCAQLSPYTIQRIIMAMLVHGPTTTLQGQLGQDKAGQGQAGQRQQIQAVHARQGKPDLAAAEWD